MARIDLYVDALAAATRGALATDRQGSALSLDDAVDLAIRLAEETHDRGNKLMFVGNGGSAGIASHMATDYSKNGNLRALAMNDGSMLTCLGNDYGYEHVFAKQIEFHARDGDLLIAISSSGRSQNILNAVSTACRLGCAVMTLSGFTPDNPLRVSGDLNFYVDSTEYGFVEMSHLALCHAVLDCSMGWPESQTDIE